MTMPLLRNSDARRLFLDRHALSETPTGPARGTALAALIDRLGFVQVDSINTVARAHDLILWSRRSTYRPDALKRLIERDRALWEHWTHDAAILPVGLFPYWKHRFDRDSLRLEGSWQRWFRDGYVDQFDSILRRIETDGPVTTADVGEGEVRGRGGWWDWHPSKTALEWLWRTGRLAITRREGFRKVYDLTERVIPQSHRQAECTLPDKIDWACSSALDRLGFATSGEIAAFWNAASPDQARVWSRAALAAGRVFEVLVEGADGQTRRHFARPDVAGAALAAPRPTTRLRVLSPFDPALRDRARAAFLFGFRYRIEVFVPEARRTYGYYVFPLLEGDQLVGRLDAKAFRDAGTLRVRALWPEPGVVFGKARLARLDAELHRLAVFAGCNRVEYLPDWLRLPLAPPWT